MHLTPDQRAHLDKEGYAVVPGMVDPVRCRQLADLAWSFLPQGFSAEEPTSWRGRIQDCCNNLPLYQRKGLVRFKAADGFRSHPAVAEAIHGDARLRALLESALGRTLDALRVRGINPNLPFPRTASLNELVGNRLEGSWASSLADRLRAPCPPQFPIAGHLETHPVELGAFLYLTDVGPGAGGLGVWPGSHHLLREAFTSPTDFAPTGQYKPLYRLLHTRRPRVIEGQAGDLILFHNRLLHTNTYNRSSGVRHAMAIDALGEGWRERAAAPPPPGQAADIRTVKGPLARHPLVQAVLHRTPADPVSAFLMRHPRLSAAVQAISKDPVSAGRKHLSAQIRRRRAGDIWIVVSQSEDYANSYKLDAEGTPGGGAYRLELPGRPHVRSRAGILVEQLEAAAETFTLRGRFSIAHHVRVVQTRTPFQESPVLFSGIVPAGARTFSGSFAPA